MPETTRRVNVSLTIPTDKASGDVLNAVLAAMRHYVDLSVESAHVHAFDLAEDAEDTPAVCLVLTDTEVRWCDAEAADVIGQGVGGVVVELPVAADYRKDAR